MSDNHNFKLFKLKEEFFNITDWSVHNIHIKKSRPNLILTVDGISSGNTTCCIPISKDDDKNHKYKTILNKYPKNVQPLNFNQYDNYALIQNFFIIKKEFIGDPFTVNSVHVSIVDDNIQKDTLKKIKYFYALYNHGKKISIQVDLNEVLQIQENYFKLINR